MGGRRGPPRFNLYLIFYMFYSKDKRVKLVKNLAGGYYVSANTYMGFAEEGRVVKEDDRQSKGTIEMDGGKEVGFKITL